MTNPKETQKLKLTSQWLARLEKVESPDVTYLGDGFPIVMKKASGMTVTDVDGNRYLDFTACFGVLALGHRSTVSLHAMRKQAAHLIHGMGDVHPTASKIKLLEKLSEITPFQNAKSILSLSGGEAMESALKTAMLATKRHKFVSFSGGYHGLHFGPLSLNDRGHFLKGFEPWVSNRGVQVPFPFVESDLKCEVQAPSAQWFEKAHGLAGPAHVLSQLEEHLETKQFAALVMEPLQGRGGERTYPQGFVDNCARLARKYGTLIIFDEIFTGLGRTGKLFSLEHHGVVPDLLCIGKALGGGFPLSACVGESSLMDVWGKSSGEARHTSTFLGHPISCAVAFDTLNAISKELPQFQSQMAKVDALIEKFVRDSEKSNIARVAPFRVRGLGYMKGFWFYANPPGFAAWLSEELLKKGFLILPSGPRGDVLSFTPPLIATDTHFKKLFKALFEILQNTPAKHKATL